MISVSQLSNLQGVERAIETKNSTDCKFLFGGAKKSYSTLVSTELRCSVEQTDLFDDGGESAEREPALVLARDDGAAQLHRDAARLLQSAAEVRRLPRCQRLAETSAAKTELEEAEQQ